MAVGGDESPDGDAGFVEHRPDARPFCSGVEQDGFAVHDGERRVHLQRADCALENA